MSTRADTAEPATPGSEGLDYAILVPEDWCRIDLESPAPDVERLITRQFRGIDNAPHLKLLVGQALMDQARHAYAAGGTELYISLLTAGPVPLPASLLISVMAPPSDDAFTLPAEELAAALAEDGDDATFVHLPSGPAVRQLTKRTSPLDGESTAEEPITELTIYAPVPGTGGFLVLTFSTPHTVLSEAMLELFDAIAASLRWV